VEFGALMMEPLTSATQWCDRVRRVEDAGLAVLHVSDHFDRSPVSPLLALAAAAQVTGRIRLGTLVLNNDFRHPAVLAKEVASLQVLCDGRLDVGLGAGWMDADYAVSGIVREQAGRRVDRLTGTVELLRELFIAGGPVTRTAPGYAVCELRDVPHPATATRLGRRTSSPPQFGQTACSSAVQSEQKVHSCEQMWASPSAARPAPQRSHDSRISRLIAR